MENKIEQQEDVEISQDDSIIVIEDSGDKKPSHLLIWIIIIGLIVACSALFWLLNQQQEANKNINQQLAMVEASLLDEAKVEQLLAVLELNTKEQVNKVQLQQNKLTDDLALLKSSQQLSDADVQYYWALAEVEYLLNIANQQALFLDDAKGASQALSLADGRVESLSDYRLHPLRALLAEELQALRAVARVDVEGMALQLQTAINQVDSLQVVMGPELLDEPVEQTATASDDWTSALSQAWQEVKSMVVIRHQQDGKAAVLVPEQRYFLYQNLRLKLEAAHFALLSGKTAAFEASLNSAQQWLADYFVGEQRDALIASLSELQALHTQVEMPDISSSLRWLKGFEQ